MDRKRDAPSRGEVSEKTERSAADMKEKEESLGIIATDFETTRRTLESLELSGTSEGADEVEHSIEGAADATAEVFEHEDEQLEQIQEKNQEHEGELHERGDSTNSDLEKISDASASVVTNETVNELVRAKDAALQDIDFLKEQAERTLQSREESEAIQHELRSRVSSNRR